MRKPLLMKHITQEEWDAMPEETQRTLIRVRTPQDKHTEMAAGRTQRPLIDIHEDNLTHHESWLQQLQEKHERLVQFVNQLVEEHNELEKRVEALERGKR